MADKIDTEPRLREMEEFFHAKIPLTRAMGLRVTADELHRFAVEAPVTLNHNHLHTAFGGSINAVATLAGYGFLWMELRRTDVHVVIRESSIRFFRPVRESIRAVCLLPEPNQLREFRTIMAAKGKSRLALRVQVEEKGIVAAQLDGVFVALTN